VIQYIIRAVIIALQYSILSDLLLMTVSWIKTETRQREWKVE